MSAGAILWLIIGQILASALGGYLAGRLRTKWVSVHTHEVYFRDTAHGFLVWCVGLVITAGFLASAAAAVAGGPGNGVPTAAVEGQTSPNAYFVDSVQIGESALTPQRGLRRISFWRRVFKRAICPQPTGTILLSLSRREPG